MTETTDYTKLLLNEVCNLVCNQESDFEEAELYGILCKALSAAETRGYQMGFSDGDSNGYAEGAGVP